MPKALKVRLYSGGRGVGGRPPVAVVSPRLRHRATKVVVCYKNFQLYSSIQWNGSFSDRLVLIFGAKVRRRNEKKLANNDSRLVLSQRKRDNAALLRGRPMIMFVVKKRWLKGPQNANVHVQGESIHVEVGHKIAKLCPRSHWMSPYANLNRWVYTGHQ